LKGRGLAAAALAAAIGAAPACTATYPNTAAPKIAGAEKTAGAFDRTAITRSIVETSHLRNWEPILEEMTGMKPLASDSARLVAGEELRRACRGDVNGCYRKKTVLGIVLSRRIYINERLRLPGSDAAKTWMSARCTPRDDKEQEGMAGTGAFPHRALLHTWVHEQGHRFDKSLGTTGLERMIGEVEAVAFEYYFAEHMAKNHDILFGMRMMADIVGAVLERWDLRQSVAALRKMDADTIDETAANDTVLHHYSIFILRASGLASFREVWRYVHETPEKEVAQRIRENARLLEQSLEIAERTCGELKAQLR